MRRRKKGRVRRGGGGEGAGEELRRESEEGRPEERGPGKGKIPRALTPTEFPAAASTFSAFLPLSFHWFLFSWLSLGELELLASSWSTADQPRMQPLTVTPSLREQRDHLPRGTPLQVAAPMSTSFIGTEPLSCRAEELPGVYREISGILGGCWLVSSKVDCFLIGNVAFST